MTEQEREELIEKMAKAMLSSIGKNEYSPMMDVTRAALEVAEPVIREECAKICDRRYNIWEDMEAHRCAAAIREGEKDD